MDGMVLPDFNKPLNKQLKQEQEKIDKIYTPFLMKFIGTSGIFTMAIKGLHNMLITRFTRLIEIVEKVYGESIDGNKFDKKNEKSDGDKKKEHWITEKWQKVIKSNFFQKTLGFLKGLASVSFITELIVFLVLLRMGIIQKFLPWILGIIGNAIVSLIKFLPTLLKMFWNLLWNVIPKILSQIFRSILKMVGLDNPIWGKITDFIAQFLPLLIAIAWAVGFIAPIIGFIMSAISVIGTILSVIGTILSLIFSPIGLIIAALVLIGILVWKFRKEIANFFIWLWEDIKYGIKMVINGVTKFFKWYIGLYVKIFKAMVKGVVWLWDVFKKGIKAIADFLHFIFVAPLMYIFKKLSKMAAPVLKKLGPVLDFFGSLFSKISNGITSAISTVQKVIGDLLNWLGAIWDYGAVDYLRNTEKIEKANKEVSQSIIVQAAESSATEEQLKSQKGLNSKDVQDIIELRQAAQTMGVSPLRYAEASAAGLLDKLDKYESGRDKGGVAKAMNFDMNKKGTFTLGAKP